MENKNNMLPHLPKADEGFGDYVKRMMQPQSQSVDALQKAIVSMATDLMYFIEENGEPVDGFRFREIALGIRAKIDSLQSKNNIVESKEEKLLEENNRLTELLGLSREQFNKVMQLPQPNVESKPVEDEEK